MKRKKPHIPRPRRPAPPAAPDPVLEGLRGLARFFGFQPPTQVTAVTKPGRPLWWCLKCNISVGEWNPLDDVKQLYCPRCRQPMKVGDGPKPPCITVSFQPALMPGQPPRQIAAPATSTESKETPVPGKANK